MLRRSMLRAVGPMLLAPVLMGGGPATSAADSTGPRLEIEAAEVDLGTVSRGATVEARFRLRNAGDRDLHILEARPG